MANYPKAPTVELRLEALERWNTELAGALGSLLDVLLKLGPDVRTTVRDNDLLRELLKAHRDEIALEGKAALAESRRQVAAKRAQEEAKNI